MKLVWTDPSLEDLRSIRDYIATGSEHYALHVIEQLILAGERLAEFPRLGRASRSKQLFRKCPCR